MLYSGEKPGSIAIIQRTASHGYLRSRLPLFLPRARQPPEQYELTGVVGVMIRY